MTAPLTAGLSIAAGISVLFTGGPLSLGDMDFTGFELPEKIGYGGQQQITTHKLPGGARVLDDMGDDPDPITWSGIFGMDFADAGARRDQMEAMKLDGEPVDLAFADASFTVQISAAKYEQETPTRIRYTITCIVIPDIDIDVDDEEDDGDLDEGEKPGTPADAKDKGQTKIARAQANAPSKASAGPPQGGDRHDAGAGDGT